MDEEINLDRVMDRALRRSVRDLTGPPIKPRRLWSLWDMMRINMNGLMALARDLEAMKTLLLVTEKTIPRSAGQELFDDEKIFLRGVFSTGIEIASSLNLYLTEHAFRMKLSEMPRTVSELSFLIGIVDKEIAQQATFLSIPSHVAKYYNNEDLFGDRERFAFPVACQELLHSANCIALGESTASVFHAMRAAETGLRALGRDLNVSFSDKPLDMAEWQQITGQIDRKIKDMEQMSRSHQKSEDMAFYSQSAAQFRYFKDGWRVRVAHGYASYDEQQAITVFTHVSDFLASLSYRLKESV